MTTVYCQTWSYLLHEPDEPLTEDEARGRHERGELYTVAWIEDGTDVAAGSVELRLERGYARIRRYDRLGRILESRTFRQHGDRMFLKAVVQNEYTRPVDESDVFRARAAGADVVTLREFEPDGTGVMIVNRAGEEGFDRWDLSLKNGETMDSHWAPIPTFGDYDGIGSVGTDAGL